MHTELTEQAYAFLTEAMGAKKVAHIKGPAGTGKTETVKDLARACGQEMIVINCSDQMNMEIMGKIHRGW